MTDIVPALGRRALRTFLRVPRDVYAGDPNHRATEDDVVHLLVRGGSAFLQHASVSPFLLVHGGRVAGRFTIIQDRKLPGRVQVAHFEAQPGLPGVREAILGKARELHPDCGRVVVGLHGHLNYGAGFLVEPHDRPPVFGLPYTPPYYLDYWEGLARQDMVSFRFDSGGFYDLLHGGSEAPDLGKASIRTMDRCALARDVAIYTQLNNDSFQRHPFWADRTEAEDWELFHPFRFLLKDENLLIAEEDGRPVAFLLWYPDFNELVGPGQSLGPSHVLRYRFRNPITTVRFTEIGLHPACRNHAIVPSLILEMVRRVEAGGYASCEGGFIFESNRLSMAMTLRWIGKAFGHRPEPSRRYCVFEGDL